MSGIRGSGVGGVGFGGEVVEEGHVGRMVRRFEGRAYHEQRQDVEQDFHECAHHQTGDLEQPHPPQNSPKHMMKESIADCIAALRMRESEEMLIEALLELKKAMSALGFPLTSIKSRELNISNCFKKKISTKLYISKVLKKRGFE